MCSPSASRIAYVRHLDCDLREPSPSFTMLTSAHCFESLFCMPQFYTQSARVTAIDDSAGQSSAAREPCRSGVCTHISEPQPSEVTLLSKTVTGRHAKLRNHGESQHIANHKNRK
jgi:hypothetical protein